MAENTEDRDLGFLTSTDRKYLRGEHPGYKDETAEMHKRADIRNRLRSAMLDATLVFQGLDDEDLEKVFEEHEEEPFHQGLVDMLALICLGFGLVGDLEPSPRDDGQHVVGFESALRSALGRAYPRLGLVFRDMDLEIDSEPKYFITTHRDMIARGDFHEAGTYPTPHLVKSLVEAREVDWDNLRDFLRDELEE